MTSTSGSVTRLVIFVKATLTGGLLFLLPLMVISFLLGQAAAFGMKLAQPVIEHLPDYFPRTGLVTGLAIFMLIAISFLAGLFARTVAGRRLTHWFEDSIFGGLPQYRLVKTMAQGLVQVENASGVSPALLWSDDAWQIGYVLEDLGNGWRAAFLPQAPTPLSGNIVYLPTERVRPLDISMVQAMSLVKRMGVGSSEMLKGVDLSPPRS